MQKDPANYDTTKKVVKLSLKKFVTLLCKFIYKETNDITSKDGRIRSEKFMVYRCPNGILQYKIIYCQKYCITQYGIANYLSFQ